MREIQKSRVGVDTDTSTGHRFKKKKKSRETVSEIFLKS